MNHRLTISPTGDKTLSPIVLIDLVAAILEVPAKIITATHEKVLALAQIPIPKLIEELWRTVKKSVIEAYFRLLGLDDEDVDVRVACDIIKCYPNSGDIESELNDAGENVLTIFPLRTACFYSFSLALF